MSVDIDNEKSFDPDRMQRAVLVWDGDCGFCKRSVIRLADTVGERIRYVTYQKVHGRFEDLDAEDFAREVHLVEPDGRIFTGAEAIFRAYDRAPGGSRLLRMYEQVPGFAPISEWFYRRIANNRPLASRVTRWFIGGDLRPPSWRLARWLFLRLIGVIASIAFLSYFVQVHGLIGADGIVPAADFLDQVRSQMAGDGEPSAVELLRRVPTILWLDVSDTTLTAVCAAGMAAGAALTFGFWPRAMLFVIWALYLSLATASGLFMGYQWDILLIETSFLAMFLAPAGLWPGGRQPVSRLGLVLQMWLLFRLMFMSGVVKLTSGDPTWRDLTAMTYHYWTQPIPSWTSYWAHHLPDWFHRIETLGVLALEIAVPLLLLMPRRLRRAGAVLLGVLQVAIIATGNYGFFNFLALALCLLALDDAPLERFFPEFLVDWIRGEGESTRRPAPGLRRGAVAGFVGLFVLVSGLQMVGEFVQTRLVPEGLERQYRPFRTVNNYGLFRKMTTDRPEILVEGSRDGETWKEYDFEWKPGRLGERPSLVTPHMPRLDWQMWFAALGDCRANPWLMRFQQRLLEGEQEVLELLAGDPFAGERPRFVRTTLWQYRFTEPATRSETGRWWRRDEIGPYCPAVTLKDGELAAARSVDRRASPKSE